VCHICLILPIAIKKEKNGGRAFKKPICLQECQVESKSYFNAFGQMQKLLGKKNHDLGLQSGQFDVLIK
jgi:hypothetical protein